MFPNLSLPQLLTTGGTLYRISSCNASHVKVCNLNMFNQLCDIFTSARAYLGLFVNVINEIFSGALTAEDLNVTGTDKRDSYA